MRYALKLGLWVLPGLLLLGLAIHAAWAGWTAVGDTEMSGHGIASPPCCSEASSPSG